MDFLECNAEFANPESTALVKETEILRTKPSWVDEEHQPLSTELDELRCDIDHLCNAWLKVYEVASVTSQAMAHYQFLVTNPRWTHTAELQHARSS